MSAKLNKIIIIYHKKQIYNYTKHKEYIVNTINIIDMRKTICFF